jgi:transcriptional regulator with XRE-family HTH domain
MDKPKPMTELTRIRQERNLSQQRLADASGVNKATINQIERGRRSPNVETLTRLAHTLEVEVADFFPKAQASLWTAEIPEERHASWDEVLRRSFEDARKAMDEGASLNELSPEQREWLQEKLAEMDAWHYGMGTQEQSMVAKRGGKAEAAGRSREEGEEDRDHWAHSCPDAQHRAAKQEA